MLPAATKLVVTDLSHLKPILESAASRKVEHESQVLLEPKKKRKNGGGASNAARGPRKTT